MDPVAHALSRCDDVACPIHHPDVIADELERAYAYEVFLAGARASSQTLAWFLAGARASVADIAAVESRPVEEKMRFEQAQDPDWPFGHEED
jgi:hypothetical protein